MIYIAAPFGNYIRIENTTSVLGTFTLDRRTGLISQILKTLRYNFKDKCWYNNLRLRNPGIKTGIHRVKKGDYISVAAIEPDEWVELDKHIPQQVPIELNISCPNIRHFDDYIRDLHVFAERNPIVKIGAETTYPEIDELIDMGFTRFHCSNTLKTDKGARSGNILRDYTFRSIRYIKNKNRHIECIAGGGIELIEDIMYYATLGVQGFSLGTVCFNPFKLRKILLDFFGK